MEPSEEVERFNRKELQKLKNMKLHETFSAGCWNITRVPGGWIYHQVLLFRGDYTDELTSVFVPMPPPAPIQF